MQADKVSYRAPAQPAKVSLSVSMSDFGYVSFPLFLYRAHPLSCPIPQTILILVN